MKTILDKINKADEIQAKKVELAKHEVELGVIQDAIKIIDNADKSYNDAFLLISTARQKAIPIIKNSISEANKFKNQLVEIKKTAKELGIDLPQEYLKTEQRAGTLIGEAQDIIDWLNKY
jgi:hypothetical protein